MQFRLLGPVQAVHNGQIVNLGGIKQRAALGFLLLQPNRVVATSQLLKALWTGEDAPTSARKILQNAIWGLRGVLNLEPGAHAGHDVTLLTQTPGYMLRVDPDQIDAQRFQHQVERGRALMVQDRAEEASRVLREALDLWRGPMVADLAEAGIIWSEVLAVQNLRLVALEEYFEAELLCGRHHAVLGELETLAEAEPLRERISGQLMLALYRCGRQADALNVFARVRTALVQSLGL
ncbi:MAG: AfsR/SARP family transcriptional regulator, partial [Actinoplanes sp.]